MWFKKGSLDADAATEASSSEDVLHPAAVDLLPIEDRYLDDGSLTVEDRARHSLVTGSTQAIPHAAECVAVGGLGTDDVGPLVRDLGRERYRVIALIAVGMTVLAGLGVYAL